MTTVWIVVMLWCQKLSVSDMHSVKISLHTTAGLVSSQSDYAGSNQCRKKWPFYCNAALFLILYNNWSALQIAGAYFSETVYIVHTIGSTRPSELAIEYADELQY